MIIIKIRHICKNTGHLVTFSSSSNIAFLDETGPFQREKKGNKVTAISYTYFVCFVRTLWRRLPISLTRLVKRKVEGGG
jgi:hypothetical protein